MLDIPRPTVQLEISITDSGIGIKQEDMSKLFKLFGKVGGRQSNSINPQGIGLGLTICNNILNKFDSYLQIESVYGTGTKFFFHIDLPYIIKSEVLSQHDHSMNIKHLEDFEEEQRFNTLSDDHLKII